MHQKQRILYVSYDGILEPLGYSQVYKYLVKQSKFFDFDLISFEKSKDPFRSNTLESMHKKMRSHNINWYYQKYSSGFGFISSLINLFFLIFKVLILALKNNYNTLHVRSYLPAIPLLFARPFIKSKIVFDIRGFWIDEKHDRLGWNKYSFKFLALKFIEKRLFKISDHVVTLTEESKWVIENKFKILSNKITCIRTCVDLKEFRSNGGESIEEINIGYLGSIDTAYDFNLFLQLIDSLHHSLNKEFRITILTKQTNLASEKLKALDLDIPFEIRFVHGKDLIESISKFTFLAFFLKKNDSLKASMPTKIGEALALGIPIICNRFNEDICKLIDDGSFGLLVDSREEMDKVLSVALSNNEVIKFRDNSVKAAKKYFDMDDAVIKYRAIYLELSEKT
jgi:glycosyltransferase involved in cell wall biosynthesis